MAIKPFSIDTPFITGEDNSLLDVLANPNAEEVDRNVALNESLRTDICEALSTLNEQQKQVIQLFFGLNNNEPLGFDDIANRLNLSKERVRQIKSKAISHLQSSSRSLKTYLGN